MKNAILTFLLIFTAAFSHSQPGTLTNIQVSQRTDGSGFVDIYFDLSGSAAAYNMSLEASFDAGSTYQPVPAAHLSGDIASVSPGNNKHLVWDGFASFPNTYSTQSKLKISATPEAFDICPAIVTDIDGNVYNTVLIGNQCWMKENLNTTRDAAGNSIIRHCYNNNTDWCDLYGGLYTWHTVMNGQSSSSSNPSGVQGICPDGWHVPSHSEWTQLTSYTGGTSSPNGNKLKSCRQVNSPHGENCNTTVHPRWNSHGTHNGTDDFGFAALPGGERTSAGNYQQLGGFISIWSSTQSSSSNAYRRFFHHNQGGIGTNSWGKSWGYYVRCVRTVVE